MCHCYITVTSYYSRRQYGCDSTSGMPGWDGKGIGMVQVEAEKKGGSDADETAAGCAERAHFFQSAVEAALLGTKYQQTGMYYSSLRSKP